MMHRFLAPLLLLPLLAAPALAQPRSFSCIGAERLEDDVFEVAFRARHADPQAEALRTPLAAALAVARADPSRNICVLGYAREEEGGQTTGTQLAARRARAVALALSGEGGIERDRIRAEARNAAFSRRAAASQARRAVVIVVLPAPIGAPPPPEPGARVPTRLTPVRPAPVTPEAVKPESVIPAPVTPPPAPAPAPAPEAPATPAAPAPPAAAPNPPAPPHPPAPSPAPDPAPPSR